MKEFYEIYFETGDKEAYIGYLDNFEDGKGHYCPVWNAEDYKKAVKDKRFFESTDDIGFITCMMTEENLAKDRRRKVYFCGKFIIWHIPERTGEHYLVYNRMAHEGQPGYSEKAHAVPHKEPGAPEEMSEWVNHYQFNKFVDGTYEAELDEAWYWGGSHTDGGTINREIPDYWQDLPYDEFLENVVTIAAASHYLFTADDLRACEGLKEFFGYC